MRRTVLTILAICGATIRSGCLLVIIAWLIGRVLTDRYAWSQWLFWIPTPVLLPVIVLALGAFCVPGRKAGQVRNRVIRWAACAVALLAYFAMAEHRLLHRAPQIVIDRDSTGQLRIVHWNAQDPEETPEDVLNVLRRLDGDVMVLTDINWMSWVMLQKDPLETGITPRAFGSLTVVSRFPITSMRPLVAVDLIYVIAVEIDTTPLFGRPITIYAVDMPSKPRIARSALMQRSRDLMEHGSGHEVSLPVPDLALGDFNTPRGSHSLSLLFPTLYEAFDAGGHGYGATFRRDCPLYHIDQILVNPDIRTLRYDIVDPGFGRHRAQIVWIAPGNNLQ